MRELLLAIGEDVERDGVACLDGMDAVIVKAQDANAYVYTPESFGASGLIAPDGRAVSHVEFCFDFELAVSKTAMTSWERAYEWDLDNDGRPEVVKC